MTAVWIILANLLAMLLVSRWLWITGKRADWDIVDRECVAGIFGFVWPIGLIILLVIYLSRAVSSDVSPIKMFWCWWYEDPRDRKKKTGVSSPAKRVR